VQLAAPDQHRTDLRQLAALAREPVRLRVDGEELRRGERVVEERAGTEHNLRLIRPAPDGMGSL
jgi:hypothetical protein